MDTPSTDGWAIYQPVIVGLGAVVLGLLANAVLEWWKSHLADRARLRTFRKALLLEFINLEEAAKTAWQRVTPMGEDRFLLPVLISNWIVSEQRLRFGELSSDEISEIAKAIAAMDGVTSVSNMGDDGRIHGQVYFIPFAHESKKLMEQFAKEYLERICAARTSLARRVR